MHMLSFSHLIYLIDQSHDFFDKVLLERFFGRIKVIYVKGAILLYIFLKQ